MGVPKAEAREDEVASSPTLRLGSVPECIAEDDDDVYGAWREPKAEPGEDDGLLDAVSHLNSTVVDDVSEATNRAFAEYLFVETYIHAVTHLCV